MPLEEAEIIGLVNTPPPHLFSFHVSDQAIKIYSSFLDGTILIPAIAENRVEFYHKILLHFSRIFDERGLTGALLDHQIEFCTLIMGSLGQFCRTKWNAAGNVPEESKIFTVQLLLGMTHAMMVAKSGENVGNRLSGNMMKVLLPLVLSFILLSSAAIF